MLTGQGQPHRRDGRASQGTSSVSRERSRAAGVDIRAEVALRGSGRGMSRTLVWGGGTVCFMGLSSTWIIKRGWEERKHQETCWGETGAALDRSQGNWPQGHIVVSSDSEQQEGPCPAKPGARAVGGGG